MLIPPPGKLILAVNAGSSNIKFALFQPGVDPQRLIDGCVDGIGSGNGCFSVTGATAADSFSRHFGIPERFNAAQVLMDWLGEHVGPDALAAIGHRLVHGGPVHFASQPLTPALREDLRRLTSLDPEHLPLELLLLDKLHLRFPNVPQVACFDTAFHHAMPRVASVVPIPRRYERLGIRRYGFHGLSCAFLVDELERLAGKDVSQGRVVLAHLGGGASMTAVRNGDSIDTSMGLTPAGGLPGSSRSGDLDPGLAFYLSRVEHMTPASFNHMVNHESGLLGISGTTGDMRELLARQAADAQAAEAVALFCYQAKKTLCALAGALEGLDTLVFSGGIGTHAPEVRARICAGLGFIGIELDPARNAADAPVISSDASAVCVRVIRTDEERMIAQQVMHVTALDCP